MQELGCIGLGELAMTHQDETHLLGYSIHLVFDMARFASGPTCTARASLSHDHIRLIRRGAALVWHIARPDRLALAVATHQAEQSLAAPWKPSPRRPGRSSRARPRRHYWSRRRRRRGAAQPLPSAGPPRLPGRRRRRLLPRRQTSWRRPRKSSRRSRSTRVRRQQHHHNPHPSSSSVIV